MKKQSPSAGIKFEFSKHVARQLAWQDVISPPYTAGTASTIKRSATMDDAGDANLEDVFKGEANETKRRKTSLMVSLELRIRKGRKCTEAWRVPVNEFATEGLHLVSKESEGSLLLSFDTKTQSIVVIFKDLCLSTKYPLLEIMPVHIHTIKRNSLETKKDLKARLFTKDDPKKPHSFDIIFRSTGDYETFLEKIQLSCYYKVASSSPAGYEMYSDPLMTERVPDCMTSDVMEKHFEEGLWLEKKTKISGTVAAKTRTMEIVELE